MFQKFKNLFRSKSTDTYQLKLENILFSSKNYLDYCEKLADETSKREERDDKINKILK